MSPDHVQAFVDQRWRNSILPALHEYIRIPNKSPHFDAQWADHGYMDAAVELLHAWAAELDLNGFSQEIVRLPGRTPLLFCEIEGSDGGAAAETPCVVLYGHYDKQPEFDGWEPELEPWRPVERDGKLYGRGGADDGYALFASLTAIHAAQHQGIPHPRCVLIIEGCEESGSYDLPFYVEHLKHRIGDARLVVCLDAECGNYDQLWATTSLRGTFSGVLQVQILNEGQHSGGAGGIVPSSFRILRDVLERVEDAASGALHACLSVEVPQHIVDASKRVAQVLGDEVISKFPWVAGAHPGNDDVADLIISNTWRPSLATVGLAGTPPLDSAGNTLRPSTSAKLVFRTPPSLNAASAAQQVKEILEQDPPYGAHVRFDVGEPQSGWSAREEAPWLAKALDQASHDRFGRPVMHTGCGGTIPFMKMLGDAYPDTEFFVTGVLGPRSNAHGPNEFLHIDAAQKVTACVVDILAAAAREFTSAR